MNIEFINQAMAANAFFILLGVIILFIILFGFTINLWLDVRYMKKRYRKMMTGSDGSNIERMLVGHVDEVKKVVEQNEELVKENRRIDELLHMAVTRMGVVRFQAFDDMGGDLSYAVALLNSHNDGVIISSIFGHEDSRSYVKPIENGNSSYTLTKEESDALHQAMASQPKSIS